MSNKSPERTQDHRDGYNPSCRRFSNQPQNHHFLQQFLKKSYQMQHCCINDLPLS